MLLDDSDLTRRAGTPSFLAPEVVFEHTHENTPSSGSSPILAVGSSSTVASLRPRPPITKAIDVWALGVTLYCLLFGKTPFFADPSLPSSEWSLYNSICNNDWEPDDKMGFDRLSTRGRHPPNDSSEGFLVICLLSRFLEKDVTQRITLNEVKRSPWLLRNLPEPEKWLEVTSPTYKINVSKAETSVAMSNVRFSWNWGAVRRIFSNLRPLHHPRLRQNNAKRRRRIEDDGRGPVMSDPSVEQRAKLPARRIVKPSGDQVTSRTPLIRSYERIADSNPNAAREKAQQRSRSIDRWYPSRRPKSATPAIQIRTSSIRPRRESESPSGRGATPASPTGSDRARARLSHFLASLSYWRQGPNSSKMPSTSGQGGSGAGNESESPSTPLSIHPRSYPASVMALPLGRNRKGQVTRHSEEALRYHQQYSTHSSPQQYQQQQQSGRSLQHGYSYSHNQSPYNALSNMGGGGTSPGPSNASGVFTTARRASSWGYEGFDSEYVDVVSLRSDRMELNDNEMIVGAGGIANDLQALMPRSLSSRVFTPTGTVVGQGVAGGSGASQLYSAPITVVGPSSTARESGRVSFYEEVDRERYGPPAFDDTSTIASGSASETGSSSGEWQRGSGLFEEGEREEGREEGNGEARSEEEDGKSEEDGDDSDDDNHVTFAPRRRPPLR
ncbi:hypothetical protein AX15_004443 [Amanita polypyramis BW_CC]|nr:hypothetical protein AX15_004443 [Amanita polypyramis BW_CC]